MEEVPPFSRLERIAEVALHLPPCPRRTGARLFGHWRDVALSFGFEEYDAPVLENEALYVRKSGEEVTQQLYNFEDKGGRRVRACHTMHLLRILRFTPQ